MDLMAPSGLHFPFKDFYMHIKILNNIFSPINLFYVSLILDLTRKSKEEKFVSLPTIFLKKKTITFLPFVKYTLLHI